MIFEKNAFTTAVSMPKSFHLTPEALTFEIHQPTLMGYPVYMKKIEDLSALFFVGDGF